MTTRRREKSREVRPQVRDANGLVGYDARKRMNCDEQQPLERLDGAKPLPWCVVRAEHGVYRAAPGKPLSVLATLPWWVVPPHVIARARSAAATKQCAKSTMAVALT